MTMLTYKLLEGSNGTYVYEYYPEGNLTKPGKISISDSGKIELLSLSANSIPYLCYSCYSWNTCREDRRNYSLVLILNDEGAVTNKMI